VISFDYRGFGLSTGSPSESGLITDAETLLSFLTGISLSKDAHPAKSLSIPPSQITLFAQSLGTAVSTALFHRWTLVHHLQPFHSLILNSGFTSIPALLHHYSFKGLTPPILSPLVGYPKLQKYFLDSITDTWETTNRIAEIVASSAFSPLRVSVLHAGNDWEIPWREGWGIWRAAVDAASGAGRIVNSQTGDEVTANDTSLDAAARAATPLTWTSSDGTKQVIWERSRHGGHNRVAASQQAMLSLRRVLIPLD